MNTGSISFAAPYTQTNMHNIALYSIVLRRSQLYCIVSIYCYVDIIQYNAMHKFVRVLDNRGVA